MRTVRPFLLICVWIASLSAGSEAQASFVNNITPSTGTGAGLNADLTSYDFTDHIGNDPGPNTNEGYVGPGALNNNFTNLNFDVLQQNSPFNVQVTRVGGNTQAAEYWFEVSLHNTIAGTINDLEINLFNGPNSGVPAQFARFDLPDGFNSTGGIFTRTSDSFAIFSGLGLASGNTHTLGFSLDFLADLVGPNLDHNSPVFVQFTATSELTTTPEPHAVVLCGLSLMGFMGVMLQHRRVPLAVPVQNAT